MKNQYRGGNCLKREGLGQCADLRGLLGKKEEGGVFEGGWYPNAHYATENKIVSLKVSTNFSYSHTQQSIISLLQHTVNKITYSLK